MHRTIRNALFFVLALISFFIFPTFAARSQGPAPGPSVEELDEILAAIQDPKKREAFIKDLKGLVAAKKALADKKKGDGGGHGDEDIFIVRWVVERFEKVSGDVRNAAVTIDDMIGQVPQTGQRIMAFLEQSESRSRSLTLIMDAGIAVMIALLSGLLLLRPVRSLPKKMKDLPSKIGWGCIYILLKGFPYLTLCIAFNISFELWPSFPSGRTVIFLFFGLLFSYRVATAIFQVMFSPDDPDLRILSVSDENAHYLWIWMRRFAIYVFFYLMLTRTLLWTHMVQDHYAHLRGLLLFPFPLMLTIFISQVSREMRAKREQEAEKEDDVEIVPSKRRNRLAEATVRYWPILAVGYTWAISLALMFQYEKGFEYLFHATLSTTVAVLILLICFRTLDLIFRRLFWVNERVKERFPGLEEKVNRYVLIVKKGLLTVLAVIGAGVIGEIWGIPVSNLVASDVGGLVILRAIAIMVTVAAVVSIIEVSNALSAHLLRERRGGERKEISQKQKTLIPVIRTAINISAGFVGGIIVLDRLGMNTTPILAGAGIVGLAVGFGSQTLVKDLINGLFILFEESIRVGDYATVGNQGGIVESVGLRTVKLRDLEGTLHVIPNSAIDSVSNYSKIFSRTVMDIGIAYREDVDEVMGILRELGAGLQRDPEYGPSILEPLEILGLDRFEDSAVIIRARFKTKPLKQWGVKREFYRRMKRVFDQQGIEIPFPHQTIYMGEPKQGKAPPLRITINEKQEAERPA